MFVDELKIIFQKKDVKEFRKFGVSVGSFLLVLGLIFAFIPFDHATFPIVAGCTFLLFGFLFPVLLKPFYIIWMSFGAIMGFFVTFLLLILLYYLVFTPVGIVLRILNVKLLEQNIEPNAESYWKMRQEKTYDPVRSEKQY